jgi:hypothetical protein
MTNANKDLLRAAMMSITSARLAIKDFEFKVGSRKLDDGYLLLCQLATKEKMNIVE